MLSSLLAFVGLSRLLLGSVSTWVSTRCSGKTLLARFAVAWRHRGVEISEIIWCWFCVEMVASLRCWFYGVYTVFDSRVCYLSQPVLRRDSSGPSFRRWRASFESRKSYKRGSRERARTLARRFKLSVFGHRPQAAGPISVRMGWSPVCTATFSRHMISVIWYLIHSVKDIHRPLYLL